MPALTVPDTGLGATIAGTGLVTSLIKRISPLTIEVGTLEITSLADTGMKKMRPGDLRENPTVEVEFYWTGGAVPITTAMVPTAEPYAGLTATITYPGAGNVAGTVFVKSVEFPNAAQGEVMMGKYVLQFDGATAPVYTSAA
jgi:hypothetical protein